MEPLKKRFLELLDKDLEFRYAVAGYLGLSEILKRLDTLSEEQIKLRKEQTKIWMEIAKLREDFNRLREDFIMLRKDFNMLREDFITLREDFNKMFRTVNLRLNRVERTLEKLTVDIEEEARSIIRHRLKTDLGLDIEVDSLVLPDLELNIYGTSDEVCVIGEATVRGGVGIVHELLRKIEVLRSKYPERLRKRIIPIIYVCLPMPELIEEAKKKDIWILKATKDYYRPTRSP
ncbi:MAG: hypothetical protein J7L11_01300 [Thermoprotei archaeon]|nr:hypothetical protein [Thermoprotei archaeon]